MRTVSPRPAPMNETRGMSERTVDAVIFDLGGVIMRNGKPSDFTRRYADHDPARVAELIMGPHHLDTDHPWHRVERGEITLAECRELTKALLAEAGVFPTESAPRPATTGTPPAFRFELNSSVVELVHDLRAAAVPIAILTNNVREFREWWWPLMDFEGTFDAIIDSHEVGMRKPDPAIYHRTLDALGARAARTAFLDDLAANVEAADRLGLHGILVEDDPSTAVALTRSITGLAAR